MNNDTSLIPLKRCSSKEACVHPESTSGWLPETTDFFRLRHKNNVLRSKCRLCEQDVNKQWRLNNTDYLQSQYATEKRRDWARRYRQRPEVKSRHAQENKRWYAKNAERLKQKPHKYSRVNPEISRQYYAKKREYLIEQSRLWQKNNPEQRRRQGRLDNQRRRARKRSLPENFTIRDWQHALDYFNNCCAACGRPSGLWHTLAQEHWIAITDPRPDNPGTVAWNILPICHSLRDGEGGCNNSKHNADPINWLNRKFGKRRAKEILARIEAYFQWVNQRGDE